MTVVTIKKRKTQKSMSSKENLNLKIIKTVQKQLNLRIKQVILEKKSINIYSFIKNHKKFIRNNKSILKHNKDLKVKGIMLLLKKLIRLF